MLLLIWIYVKVLNGNFMILHYLNSCTPTQTLFTDCLQCLPQGKHSVLNFIL